MSPAPWNPTFDDPPSSDVLDLARTHKPASVLDVGCGSARNLTPFDQPGAVLHGVDLDADSVRTARTRLRDGQAAEVHIDHADLLLFEPPRRYELVLCYGVLHFLPVAERHDAYDRLRNWTEPGGMLSIVMFNAATPIPADLRDLMPDIAPDSTEIAAAFTDWDIIRLTSYTYTDEHDGGRIHHTHSIDRLLARRTGPL